MIIYLATILILLCIVSANVIQRSRTDQYGPTVLLNQDGDGKALIIYFPGLSSVQKDLSTSFAEGLLENNWLVDIYYANEDAPDPTHYDLLVLGTPSYGQKPAPSITRYLERVRALEGIDTVVIASAAGNSGIHELVENVKDRGGNVVLELEILTLDPNTKTVEPEKTVYVAAKKLSK
jgi:flavorubredoxin